MGLHDFGVSRFSQPHKGSQDIQEELVEDRQLSVAITSMVHVGLIKGHFRDCKTEWLMNIALVRLC